MHHLACSPRLMAANETIPSHSVDNHTNLQPTQTWQNYFGNNHKAKRQCYKHYCYAFFVIIRDWNSMMASFVPPSLKNIELYIVYTCTIVEGDWLNRENLWFKLSFWTNHYRVELCLSELTFNGHSSPFPSGQFARQWIMIIFKTTHRPICSSKQ